MLRVGWCALVVALSLCWAGAASLGVAQEAGEAADVSVEVSQSEAVEEVEEGGPRAWDVAKQGALLGVERLKQEIQMLSALSVLQNRLLEWNTVLVESGVGPSRLEVALCEEEELRVWCGILPATFGLVEEDG